MTGMPSKQDYTNHYTVVSAVLATSLVTIVNEEFFAGQSIWIRAGIAFLFVLIWMMATMLMAVSKLNRNWLTADFRRKLHVESGSRGRRGGGR